MYSSQQDQRLGENGGIVSLENRDKMTVASSDEKGELRVDHTRIVTIQVTVQNPHGEIWPNYKSDVYKFKGRITKVGDDYKYIQDDHSTCEETFQGKASEQVSNLNCDPNPKTYTLRIQSEDEIVMLYKPTGEEFHFRRE